VLDRGKPLGRPPRDPLRRRIGRDEIRMFSLELFELVKQPIELLVRDFRRVVNVVELFVAANGLAELVDAGERIHAVAIRGSRFAVRSYRSRAST
jgi:hypothetical protein